MGRHPLESHLVETLGSNLIFGFGVGWLLSDRAAIAMETPSGSFDRPSPDESSR
jgi:hypothetical protein